jgi:hypothetical protein
MKKTIVGLLALLMLFSLPFAAAGASNLSTEQKFEVLRQKSIFTGFVDGSTRLYDSMSREQLAAVLYRLLELPTQAPSPSYGDVLKTRWSYQEIETVTRVGLMNGTRNKVFSPQSTVTVEQLAAVFIRSYGFSGIGSTPVTGTVSKWARGAVSLALDRMLIPQLSDYTVDAPRRLLVDAAYAVYESTHPEPLRVRSVEVLSNQTVRVNLLQLTDKADISRFTLRDNYGNNRSIQQVAISQDGMSVTLWTDRQIGSLYHTLTIDGTAYSYTSISEDTTKPQVVTQPVRLPNQVIEITFSEPIEYNSATNTSNFQLNNGLKLKTLQLSSDLRRVTFTTAEQSDGKAYQLTIRNVKDLVGNVMDTRNDLYFTGSNDSSKPKVASVQVNANAWITIKFSEKINLQNAVNTSNYSIDRGLTVIQATVDNEGRVVTLRTSAQQDATLYTLTVVNIPDLAGNVMDTSTNWKFGGVANPEIPVRLQSFLAVNQNTVEVTFDRTFTDSDVSNLKLAILSDNGSGVSMNDWQANIRRKAGSDKVVTVQYRNKSSNPELFKAGHVYNARVTGVAGLLTDNDANRTDFAGTNVANRDPYVTQVIVVNRTTVKVIFSELVTNVNEPAFRIKEKDGGNLEIDYDELNDTGKVVTEVNLKLKGELQGNRTYAMTFQPNIIVDAPGWNGLQTMEGSQPFTVYFNTN